MSKLNLNTFEHDQSEMDTALGSTTRPIIINSGMTGGNIPDLPDTGAERMFGDRGNNSTSRRSVGESSDKNDLPATQTRRTGRGFRSAETPVENQTRSDDETKNDEDSTSVGDKIGPKREEELSRKKKQKVRKLEKRDREVRQHERAHMSTAPQYVKGGPQYEYKRGPDGKRYAVSGHVNMDTSEGDTPKETIKKMQAIKRAALAPANPSSQDQKVASDASQKLQEARRELREKQNKEVDGESETANTENNATSSASGEDGASLPRETEDTSRSSRTSNKPLGLQNLRVDQTPNEKISASA